MQVEPVEIYSDATNRAVLRHPGRKFPGVLVQGDSLYNLCKRAGRICLEAKDALGDEAYYEMNALRNTLWDYLVHYKVVLGEHSIPLPFSEQP